MSKLSPSNTIYTSPFFSIKEGKFSILRLIIGVLSGIFFLLATWTFFNTRYFHYFSAQLFLILFFIFIGSFFVIIFLILLLRPSIKTNINSQTFPCFFYELLKYKSGPPEIPFDKITKIVVHAFEVNIDDKYKAAKAHWKRETAAVFTIEKKYTITIQISDIGSTEIFWKMIEYIKSKGVAIEIINERLELTEIKQQLEKIKKEATPNKLLIEKFGTKKK